MRLAFLLLAIALALAFSPRGVRAAMFKSVPEHSWEFSVLDSLMQVGIVEGQTAGSGPTFRRTFTRYELAMVIIRAVEKINNEQLAESLSQSLALDTLALVAEYSREICRIGVESASLQRAVLNVTERRVFPALRNPILQANPILYKDVPTDDWPDAFLCDLVESGIGGGFPVDVRSSFRKTFVRYEGATITWRAYKSLQSIDGNAQIPSDSGLKLMALTAEFAPELRELGHDPYAAFYYLSKHITYQKLESET